MFIDLEQEMICSYADERNARLNSEKSSADIPKKHPINAEDFLPTVINMSLQKRLTLSEFKLRFRICSFSSSLFTIFNHHILST